MALTDDEKAQLEALQAKENEPESDDDEYIEIWDDTGAGAKVKRSTARPWLKKFGIDLDELVGDTPEDQGAEGTKGGKKAAPRPPSTGNVTHAAKYFGNKAS